MLEIDRRRAARRQHAERQLRREWFAKNAKWEQCPNSGLTARWHHQTRWSDATEPLVLVQASGDKKLVCKHCKSSWLVHADFSHP